MPVFTDQLGRMIVLPNTPRRIVSLVPSQTELLFDLGLDDEVVGITKFCVHPEEWFRTKTSVGGTKQLHIDKIRELKPDLVIANKEENSKEQIEQLSQEFPVWISNINELDDALKMIGEVGAMTRTQPAAEKLVQRIKENFEALESQLSTINYQSRPTGSSGRASTAYLIWQKPYMTVGGDTFIHDMMGKAGFANIFGERERYPEITIDDLQAANCELLLLSSEPFPFGQKHVDELSALLPGTKIQLVDGEMFSWYGSRMLYAPEYFSSLRQLIAP